MHYHHYHTQDRHTYYLVLLIQDTNDELCSKERVKR
jgi:hypothetical protein